MAVFIGEDKFLVCLYSTVSQNPNETAPFVPVAAGAEMHYIISEDGMRAATQKEYGINMYGQVMGQFSYDASAESDEKKATIGKAVVNKSNIITYDQEGNKTYW